MEGERSHHCANSAPHVYGGTRIEKGQGRSSCLDAVLLPLSMSRLKRSTGGSTAESFALPFRYWGIELKKKNDGGDVLYPLGLAHKAGSYYLLRVLFKISDEHPRPFCMGVPPESGLGYLT